MFVLERELAEVHLLLDNVSANPHTTVAERTVETGTEDELPSNWIEQICDITWPPEGSDEERAEDAALLIRAKDHLNRLSYPASGATIAFTTLVTQCDLRPRPPGAVESAEESQVPAVEDEASGGEAPPAPAAPACPASESPTRRSLAETAYPDLVVRARSFANWMWWISMVLLGVLILTCAFSWYVAYGNAALAELTVATQVVDAAQKRVDQAETSADKPALAPSGSAAPAPSPPPPPSQPAPPKRFVGYCERLITTADQKQACAARAAAVAARQRVEQRLAAWTFGIWSGDPSGPASLANILGSAVLPFFYGLLGAAAAVVRSLSRKIRSSLLSPRDLPLSLQQLALGAVMGACIGLFIAAPGDAGKGGESLLAPTGLSGPAISFIAGFGVEAVFQALEELIRRVFNVSPIAAVDPLPVPNRTVIVRSNSVRASSVTSETGDDVRPLDT